MLNKTQPRYAKYELFVPRGEVPLLLSDLARQVGRSYDSVRYHAISGTTSVDGEVVRLEVCRLLGGMGSTIEAWHRYTERLNGYQET